MKLGITTIQRNRGPWIKEWIAFHYLVGFRKFYFFTHNCTDNTNEVLNLLKKNIDIEIIPVDPNLEAPQLKCYQKSCDNYLDKVDWMAFIDSDEFLFPTNANSLDIPLEEYNDKNISALGVYWLCFGSSGFINEPSGLIIENYKYRPKDGFSNNRHIKSIIKGGSKKLIKTSDPHYFETPLGTFDENLRPITYGQTNYEPTYNKFQINHYVCQSRSYFLQFKKNCGKADGEKSYIRNEDWWIEHDKNEVIDHTIDKFIKPLKKILTSI